ncbi:histidine ammonia-lyase [Cytobacillus sp.]|uniref:HAL/PAL/TAL family ammonia-lyase n=1 Tax=Cytobacillus sp. TaxID=2675269 RepID=UPI0035137114
MHAKDIRKVVLGNRLTLGEVVAVARFKADVEFSAVYQVKVDKSRRLLEKQIEQGEIMYGVNTGFGALYTQIISPEETAQLQRNILLSHAASVGEPLPKEVVRAIMLMVLQNLGQGYSGVRLETLEMYRQFLNLNLTPFSPKEGSVGYLSPEAHIALVLIGEGQAYFGGELMSAKKALHLAGIEPITLSAKEGLALTSGTTSPTGMGALALYDMLKAAETADIIGAMSLEVLKGTVRAFDERLISVRPHKEQQETASNIRKILSDSHMAKAFENYRLQDPLSLRAIPQLHGAAKKTLNDAHTTIEIEMNGCSDNPILWPDSEEGGTISGCNCDSSYVGIELDSACIAAAALAKMSERRNSRLINEKHSELPNFLIKNAGLNSGLMIPQYSQAGLLNDMKILSHPATADSIPTCADQEDYVAMGYNAAKKAREVASKLEYVLAIELLSIYTAHQLTDNYPSPGSASQAVLDKLACFIPKMEEDQYLYPFLEGIRDLIHSGEMIQCVEDKLGKIFNKEFINGNL